MRLLFIISLIVTLLSACGLGGNNLTLPGERPHGTIKGEVLGGLYTGGEITAYTFDEKNTPQFAARTTIQENGSFTLSLQAPTQPVLLKATGGRYLDPRSLQIITTQPNFILSLIFTFESGETHNTSITPSTHFAAGLLKYWQQSTEKKITPSQVTLSNQKIDALYFTDLKTPNQALNISIPETPSLITIEGDEKQGLFINALAQIAYEERLKKEETLQENFNFSSLTRIIYDDIRSDGLLDGKAASKNNHEIQSLAFGDITIDSNFYRLTLAFALRKALGYSFLPNTNSQIANKAYLLSVAQNENELYVDISDTALQTSIPLIKLKTDATLALRSVFDLVFSIDNTLTLTDITLTLGEIEYKYEPGENSKSAGNLFVFSDIDSTNYADGTYQIMLIAKDSFDNEGMLLTEITIDNTPPELIIKSAELTNESQFELKGSYFDTLSQITSITIEGENIPFDIETGWKKEVTLLTEENTFIIIITDAAGNESRTIAYVSYDELAPVITLSSATLTSSSQFELRGNFIEKGPSGVKKITVNGDPAGIIASTLEWSKSVLLNRGINDFTIGIEDGAGNYTEFPTQIILDDLPPSISISSAALTNNSDFLLEGTYEERNLGQNNITVIRNIPKDNTPGNNIATLSGENQWSIPVTLQPGKNEFLISSTDEIGNSNQFKTEVILDELAPEITVTSESISNDKQFTLSGTYVDGETGVNNITVNDISTTLLDNEEWAISLTLEPGNNNFVIRSIDEAGNSSDFTTTVFLDITPPSLTITSESFTGTPQFLVEGTYIENESGIQRIYVNDDDANILANQNWSITVPLTNGSNNLTIGIEDKAGNVYELETQVLLDDLAPSMTYVDPINIRFSNNDGTFFVGKFELVNNTPFFIELNQLALSGMAISKENLANANIPYLVFHISDQPLEGIETPSDALRIDYRYSINDSTVVDWQSILLDLTTNEILFPLVAETLSSAWYKSIPSDAHTLEIRTRDNSDNETIETIKFNVQFFVPELSVEFNETLESIADGNFSTRINYINQEIVALNFDVRNPTDQAIKIRLTDESIHSVTQQYESVQRVHKIKQRTEEVWQRKKIIGLHGSACPQLDEENPEAILKLWKFNDGSWLKNEPNAPTTKIIDVFTDTPTPPIEPWAAYVSNNQTFMDVENRLFSQTYTYGLDFLFDVDILGTLAASANPGYVSSWVVTAPNGVTIPANGVCPDINGVQTKTMVSYLPVDDEENLDGPYPKNIEKTLSVNKVFATSKFGVFGEDLSILEPVNDDWYIISPDQTIHIKKYIKTPALTLYNDNKVKNPGTITDYNLRRLDKKFTWNIDQSLTIETQFNPEGALDNQSSIRLQNTLSGENKQIIFERD